MNTKLHTCGGTVLSDCGAAGYLYCDRCGAFTNDSDADDGTLPSGEDKEFNRQAFDAGDIRSPDADETLVRAQREADCIINTDRFWGGETWGGYAQAGYNGDAQEAAEAVVLRANHDDAQRVSPLVVAKVAEAIQADLDRFEADTADEDGVAL